tara:strand:- start:416 stop:661 length:246 start_codon:yes stop_codon:yes gene_type:complete
VIVSLSETDPLYRITVLPASAIPDIVGVESFVVVDIVVSVDGALGAVSSKYELDIKTIILINLFTTLKKYFDFSGISRSTF